MKTRCETPAGRHDSSSPPRPSTQALKHPSTPADGLRPANSEPRTQNSEPRPCRRTQAPEHAAAPAAANTSTQAPKNPSAPPSGRIIAGIPCLNTAAHIADVVKRTLPFVDEVVVIDDGSSDGTAAIAAAAGATVVRHEKNLGYGAAIRSCFEYAASHHAGILVTIDGDGQHYPEDIPALLAAIRDRGAAMASGSRFLKGASASGRASVPRYRAFGIRVITLLFNMASGCRVTDAQCGLRAYSSRAIKELVPGSTSMDVSVELLVAARAKGLRIVEVPVAVLYHDGSSTLHPIPHGVRVALAVLHLRGQAVLSRWRGRVDSYASHSSKVINR